MVKVIHTSAELKALRDADGAIGFVPTMGNLHQGHISLLERALTEYETVYFSIFVNPKQFGPNEDFNRYPRTLQDDLNLIEKLTQRFPKAKVVVYSPKDPLEVFPANDTQTISVQGLNNDLEGKIRPGHFDGVATVVYRLFAMIRPNTAYFGLKDYQQYLVIRQMVKDLVLPIKVQGMPIIREESGLAMSSRNQYLSAEQKNQASILYKTLTEVKNILNNGHSNIAKAHQFIRETLKDPKWDYLEIRDAENFSTDLAHSKQLTILAVYQMGQTRLLDNMQVEIK